MFPKPAIEALRGSARPGRGQALDAERIGTRTKRDYIILLLKSQFKIPAAAVAGQISFNLK